MIPINRGQFHKLHHSLKFLEHFIGEKTFLCLIETKLLYPNQLSSALSFMTKEAQFYATENIGNEIDDGKLVTVAFLKLFKHIVANSLETLNFDIIVVPLKV